MEEFFSILRNIFFSKFDATSTCGEPAGNKIPVDLNKEIVKKKY